jgi:hypothetical protein
MPIAQKMGKWCLENSFMVPSFGFETWLCPFPGFNGGGAVLLRTSWMNLDLLPLREHLDFIPPYLILLLSTVVGNFFFDPVTLRQAAMAVSATPSFTPVFTVQPRALLLLEKPLLADEIGDKLVYLQYNCK